MHCPRCAKPVLFEKERDGVTVDQCPDCRGVWLDRGELERILSRVQREFDAEPVSRSAAPLDSRQGRRHDDDDDSDDGFSAHPAANPRRDESSAGHPPRKRGFLHTLGELFD